ncbi:MAG TPA: hypothetical protein RMH85_16715 [Polyangiaceae bacterium LLY-WYZ-15_(1-7)]|nr:hypothetical protein [Polyangiaceae bacterium LLY-WYZ-15_(1-7)]HJL06585.1 hypothetical protein [Polyangiaceae bacterium LLY-WYZ-15_(1-7)]HJL10145.1 hypothetical protein [Polyangiaceae bacterium LLY-WYZ-15_(1-7)]HJL30731.1 hypothetical protein [Polyangiaceae bacterium LLY-WYZ-15_(1-7)]HJL38783.1 hypothetical protein [Polyangiaceae bacterium LLY-WYZ-15_(1-7)]
MLVQGWYEGVQEGEQPLHALLSESLRFDPLARGQPAPSGPDHGLASKIG